MQRIIGLKFFSNQCLDFYVAPEFMILFLQGTFLLRGSK